MALDLFVFLPGLLSWTLCFLLCAWLPLWRDPRGNSKLPSVLFSTSIVVHLLTSGVVDVAAALADGSGVGGPNEPAQTAALAWCAAWFAVDLVNDCAVLGERGAAMVAHHVMGGSVCALPLFVGHGGCEVLVLLAVAECSTPFLSLALVYKGTALETPLWVVFAALFVFIRFVARNCWKRPGVFAPHTTLCPFSHACCCAPAHRHCALNNIGCSVAPRHRGIYATKMLYFTNVSDTHPGNKVLVSGLVILSYFWIGLILKKVGRKTGVLKSRPRKEEKKRA